MVCFLLLMRILFLYVVFEMKSGLNIGDSGASSIGEALKVNSTIATLDLELNKIRKGVFKD